MTMLWKPASLPGDETIGHYTGEVEQYRIPFYSAVSLVGQFPETTLEIVSESLPADHFTVGMTFVISEPVKRSLEESNVKAEFFELKILYRGALYTEKRYYFLNVLDKVDCIDLERSDYVMETDPRWADEIQHIRDLVIDESKAAGHDLFLLARIGLITCVSDELGRRLNAGGFRGFRCVGPDETSCY